MKIEKWDEINGASHEKKLEAFIESTNDCYAIMQLKRTEETAMERFASMTELNYLGKTPQIDHYEIIYVAPMESAEPQSVLLESLYEKFNLYHPEDFRGHSLSVSDIVALKANDVVSCHYVDTIGFKELPDFMKPENYLKNAEMSMEDDYGMIDGVINNGKGMDSLEKPSVLEKLKEPSVIGEIKKPSKAHLERELE